MLKEVVVDVDNLFQECYTNDSTNDFYPLEHFLALPMFGKISSPDSVEDQTKSAVSSRYDEDDPGDYQYCTISKNNSPLPFTSINNLFCKLHKKFDDLVDPNEDAERTCDLEHVLKKLYLLMFTSSHLTDVNELTWPQVQGSINHFQRHSQNIKKFTFQASVIVHQFSSKTELDGTVLSEYEITRILNLDINHTDIIKLLS